MTRRCPRRPPRLEQNGQTSRKNLDQSLRCPSNCTLCGCAASTPGSVGTVSPARLSLLASQHSPNRAKKQMLFRCVLSDTQEEPHFFFEELKQEKNMRCKLHMPLEIKMASAAKPKCWHSQREGWTGTSAPGSEMPCLPANRVFTLLPRSPVVGPSVSICQAVSLQPWTITWNRT